MRHGPNGVGAAGQTAVEWLGGAVVAAVLALAVIAAAPGVAVSVPEHFRRLVKRVDGDSFARFMSDAATPRDEAKVIAALPKRPFTAAALSASQGRRVMPARLAPGRPAWR